MINSLRYIPYILDLFPKSEAPETSKDYDGYYHPYEIKGNVSLTEIDFILRDFDEPKLKEKIQAMQTGISKIQKQCPEVDLSINIKRSYKNMKAILDKHPTIIKIAKEAIEKSGANLKITPVRGGTDGARFSWRGLPTPNIFTGGYNFHTKLEFASVTGMKQATLTILNIIKLTVEEYIKKN